MVISFIKFIHIMASMSLLGCTFFCFARSVPKASFDTAQQTMRLIHKFLLLMVILAIMTGTFLVYPKNFTFHTPWIQAAYVLALIYLMLILLIIRTKSTLTTHGFRFIYGVLVLILVFITHDAITKTTFLEFQF